MDCVSVVIPAYNQARFVGEAVASVLAQTAGLLEVVVIDDGSTDGTAGVLHDYAGDPRVVVLHQSNAGLPATRNRGIRESRGSHLLFLDADDLLTPGACAEMLQAQQASPECGFVYCDVAHIDENGRPIDPEASVRSMRKRLDGDLFDQLLPGGYFPVHSVLILRSVLDRVGGFDQSLPSLEDFDLWLRVAAAGVTAKFIDKRLVCYRRYAGSMSRNAEVMRESYARVLRKLARACPDRLAEGIVSLQDLHQELWTGNCWLNDQRLRWQQLAEERERAIEERERAVEELRAAARRLDAERAAWQERALRAEGKEPGATGAPGAREP